MSGPQFCACGFEGWDLGVFSRAWHIEHKVHHLAVFPNIASDEGTVRNLNEAIEQAQAAS